MRRYHEEGAVFQSAERGALHCVEAIDDEGCDVTRLTEGGPERCTFSQYDTMVALLRQNGGRFALSELDRQAARRAAYLQGPDLGLAADRRTVLLLDSPADAAANLRTLITGVNVHRERDTGEPKLYKPALLACVLEGVLSGELTENRISFDWALPRFRSRMSALGREGGAQQCAYAFCNLSNDLFWVLCYHDPRQYLPPEPSLGVIRERVRHATLQDAYWRTLADAETVHSYLGAIADRWWPKGAADANADPLVEAFRRFRSDPVERVRVRVRRERAGQLRTMWEHPETFTLDRFNREVWLCESSTVRDGVEVKGRLEGALSAAEAAAFSAALDNGRLELHGNYVWAPGSSIFAPSGDLAPEAKLDSIHRALQIALDP
ncbi:MAG TPA: hypothetical protein VH092_26090, partial [Urbifossiella sp.]|nr:hypothetical protein [Urbifossiella sp.]